jgi:hypothetical protein
MEIRIVEPVDLTDDELAGALILATMLRHSGACMESEIGFLDNLVGRIDSLIAARHFVAALLTEVDRIAV